MQSKRRWVWGCFVPLFIVFGLSILVAGVTLLTTGFDPVAGPIIEVERGGDQAAEKIALIRLQGTIVSAGPQGGITGYVMRALKKAERDPRVKVVLLEIDSPGGSVTDSDRIHHRVEALKAAGKKVFVLFGDLCASGGYYVAVAADQIWSRPTSITGSIGVIVPSFSMVDLLQKLGVRDRSIASGANKQILSLSKEMNDEQRRIIESVVMEMYERFVSLIAKGRRQDVADVKVLADGRLYSAQQAKMNGLVDEIGYRDDLVKHLRDEYGELLLVEYQAPVSFLDSLAGGNASPSFERWFSTRLALSNRPAFLFSPLE